MSAPFVMGSDTSFMAANSIGDDALNELERRVLWHIARCGKTGATDAEIQDELQMGPSTERPRRVDLVGAGLIMDSGIRRRTPTGRAATVWVISAFAPLDNPRNTRERKQAARQRVLDAAAELVALAASVSIIGPSFLAALQELQAANAEWKRAQEAHS